MQNEKLRQTIEKSTATKVQMMLDGTLAPYVRGIQQEHLSPKVGRVWCRSSFEKRYVELLDADDDVVTYEVEPLALPYAFNGTVHSYLPDYIVTYSSGKRTLVEVKPKRLVDQPKNVAKRLAAQVWCEQNGIGFATVTENELHTYPS